MTRRGWLNFRALRGSELSVHSYKTAWDSARKKAGLDYRLYDARHTFVTRLAENPSVSEETIRQLAGHVSPRMLSQYAHVRVQARRAAIATLEQGGTDGVRGSDLAADGAQNWPQSKDAIGELPN
jgi:integrase